MYTLSYVKLTLEISILINHMVLQALNNQLIKLVPIKQQYKMGYREIQITEAIVKMKI